LVCLPNEQVSIAEIFDEGGRLRREQFKNGAMGSRGKPPEIFCGQFPGSRRESSDIIDKDDGRNLGHWVRFVLSRAAGGKRDVGRTLSEAMALAQLNR